MFNWTKLNEARDELRDSWAASGDIPYILIDDFLEPGVGEQLADFAGLRGKWAKPRKRNHKHVYMKNGTASYRVMTPLQREFFEEANSQRFCEWVNQVTGVDPVYADTELFGGGLHEIRRGGYLNIHTDFNHHPNTLKHRRFNLLVYLNPVWEDSWNGHIELWDLGLSRPFLKAAPTMGRALLFETSERSFHGHPAPLNVPAGVSRRSLATYYYSEFPAGLSPRKFTNYQLTRQQWAQLLGEIADSVYAGADVEAIVSALQFRYQTADIRAAHQVLMGLRSAKYTDEPYWESADGERTIEEPRDAA
jgi:Rps23 Pro-64 3,4-dihydroxylase Tpa1-like proline 4-hydroxylase